MWLENQKFREIGHAVCKGERSLLGRLMSEVWHPENQNPRRLTLCPRCHKPLVHKMLPDLEYLVLACPDQHGAWMSPEVSGKLQHLIKDMISENSARFSRLGILGPLSFAALILTLLLHTALFFYKLELEKAKKIIPETSSPSHETLEKRLYHDVILSPSSVSE